MGPGGPKSDWNEVRTPIKEERVSLAASGELITGEPSFSAIFCFNAARNVLFSGMEGGGGGAPLEPICGGGGGGGGGGGAAGVPSLLGYNGT